jgi:ribokinase
VILLDARRQNHIVAVYGANMRCDAREVAAVERALDGADMLLLQMEVPMEVSLQAARAARDAGVPVVWDPAPAGPMQPGAFMAATVLTPNQAEAEKLTGIEVSDPASAREAATALRGRGAEAAVIKLGEQGAYYLTGEAGGHVPGYTVEVVDTVAAGDAFAGALAVSLVQGGDLETAVRLGVAAGAAAVTHTGAQEAMPDRHEVDALLSPAGV